MALTQYLVIAPIADKAGVETATGFVLGAALYTAADPAPRVQSHCWAGAPYTPAQEAAIETPVTGARAVFPATHFEKYNRITQRHIPLQRLDEMGLTNDPN